jgi:hypothetical protein
MYTSILQAQFRLRANWLACLAVTVAATLPFLGTLNDYFISDDFGVLSLFSQKPALHFLTLFTSPWTEAIYGGWTDELRPTLALTFQLAWFLGGGAPLAFHLSVLAFHLATALLVLGIARVLARLSLAAACFAAVLFAVSPVHAETVAWTQGHADSIPAFLILATLLAYGAWRRSGKAWQYGASVGLYFLALYSKQSAITLPAALLLYDFLVERRSLRPSWTTLKPYVPFVLLTMGYLGLRLVLFGHAVREDKIGPETFLFFAVAQSVFLQLLAFGRTVFHDYTLVPTLGIMIVAASVLFLYAELRTTARKKVANASGLLAFFGPAWWIIGVAPLAVTYVTPRHLYLVAAGIAICLGVAFDRLWRSPLRNRRLAVATAASGLVVASLLALQAPLKDWHTAASLSEQIRRDVEREASDAPPGSLVVLGAPGHRITDAAATWVWAWAMPFAVQPPFTREDLTQRVIFIETPDAYCCWEGDHWSNRVREAIGRWASLAGQPTALVLSWDRDTGALDRRTDVELPALREDLLRLREVPSSQELRERLEAIVLYATPSSQR